MGISVDLVVTSNDSLSGVATRDGVTPVAGTTRILAVAQTTASQNGPWLAQSGAWTRPTDFNTDANFVVGQILFVQSGALGSRTSWQLQSGNTLAGAKSYAKFGCSCAPAPALVATSNIALTGVVTVDGVASNTVTGDVLCVGQTTSSQNGYWKPNAGAWTRPSYYSSDALVAAALGVASGTVLNGTLASSIWYQSAGLTIAGAKSFKQVAAQPLWQATSVITADVASLAAAPSSNDGYTFLNGDVVALANQTTTANNRLYTSNGAGVLTPLAVQPLTNSLLTVTKGVNGVNALWKYATASITSATGSAATYIGPNGTIGEQAPDGAGYLKTHLYNRWASKTSIANAATVTVFSFDHSAEGMTGGNLDFRASVLWLTNSGTNRARSSIAWTVDATVPPANLYKGPRDDVDDTSTYAAGTANRITLTLAISANTVQLLCTNNTGSTINVSTIVEGYLAQ